MNYMDNPYGGINTRYPWKAAQSLAQGLPEKKQEIKQGLADELKDFLEPYLNKAEARLTYTAEQARYWGMFISVILIALAVIGITLQGISLYKINSLTKRLFEETNVFTTLAVPQ